MRRRKRTELCRSTVGSTLSGPAGRSKRITGLKNFNNFINTLIIQSCILSSFVCFLKSNMIIILQIPERLLFLGARLGLESHSSRLCRLLPPFLAHLCCILVREKNSTFYIFFFLAYHCCFLVRRIPLLIFLIEISSFLAHLCSILLNNYSTFTLDFNFHSLILGFASFTFSLFNYLMFSFFIFRIRINRKVGIQTKFQVPARLSSWGP